MVRSTLSVAPDEEQVPDAPYFIKPSGFRPNSIFIGRQAELAELHKLLFDRKKRAEGTSAVLIQSMPGGGKTHLARQYVYEHKELFPGGIFWLRAKSQTELASGFWDIARKAALKQQSAASPPDPGCVNDPERVNKIVKKWLNRREDWLLVLDGIHFDDPEGLKRFIPDGVNTSLIYTSTEKSVSGDHHFMNPELIKLPLLSAREAQLLLLKELDKKEPFSKDDLKHSMELVQSIGLLPLVIHTVAQRLKLTNEHLGRFAKSYASEPRLRGLGAYVAVVDQLKILGAYEALNLMYILCFFSQHIPVEMINLGLPALDELRIPIRASEPVTGSTLNNTFKMLNIFALIDRNEHDISLQSSQSSKGSVDMLADNVDVIRLHSVVQGFFADTLLADKDHTKFPLWLDRAVQLFCCSYDMANERITKKTNAGLVEDYRLYEIHGIKLREHVTRREKKIPMPDTLRMLERRLSLIKMEIDRRTPESSSFIAGGKPDAFQTSIFDRTSSSSETGPETPAYDLKIVSAASTWGPEPDKAKFESPTSIINSRIEFRPPLQDIPRNHFPPLPFPEDPGYDSDQEGSIAMTVQPSQQTMVPDLKSPVSPSGAWETVKPRRSKVKPGRLDLRDHRTTRTREKQRYSDSAGAFRAINAVDPRVAHPHLSRELAEGFVQNASSREQYQGRISGKSHAQVALAHISKNSPPPARGGGMIMDRRPSSQRGSDSGRMMTAAPSYAAAVSAPTRDNASGFRQQIRSASEPVDPSSDSAASLGTSPYGSAMEALQKFHLIQTPKTHQVGYTPMPPYPQTPEIEYDQPFRTFPHSSQVLQNVGQENIPSGVDSTNIYSRNTGPLTIETRHSGSSPPLRHDLSHNSSAWHSQGYSESLPSSLHEARNSPFVSLSSPDIRRDGNVIYVPGHPEFSTNDKGYTSQPMSRDPSGQSTHSNHSARSANLVDRNRRRPSLAETEPVPQLPTFSPIIPPTSYQVYERMRRSETLEKGTLEDREGEMLRQSPRTGFARVSKRLDEWTVISGEEKTLPPSRRQFNPAAPSFSPSPSAFAYSPSIPAVPPNSNSSLDASRYPSPFPAAPLDSRFSNPPSYNPSQYSSPYQLNALQGTSQTQLPPRPLNEGDAFEEAKVLQAPEMGRAASGGMVVGRRVIEFGDFPEPVDYDLARERAERGRERISREESHRLEGLGISDLPR